MVFEIISHAAEVKDNLDKAIEKALEKCGIKAEGYAYKLCPKRTGRLANSIAHTVRMDEKAVYIGTNVSYGPHVELGTKRQKAQPYLKPAVTDHAEQYNRIAKKAMKGE